MFVMCCFSPAFDVKLFLQVSHLFIIVLISDYFRIGLGRKGNSGTHAFQRAAKHENAKFKTFINIGDGEAQD